MNTRRFAGEGRKSKLDYARTLAAALALRARVRGFRPEDVRRAITPDTVLITLMHANNELGTVQPIAEIAALARERKIPFHTDAVQSAGKLPLVLALAGTSAQVYGWAHEYKSAAGKRATINMLGGDATLREPHQPGAGACLVLDVRMPGMSGLQLQEMLLRLHQNIPTIFITGHGDVPMAVNAIKRGALDFIEKPFRDQELLTRIESAVQIERGLADSEAGRTIGTEELERRIATWAR